MQATSVRSYALHSNSFVISAEGYIFEILDNHFPAVAVVETAVDPELDDLVDSYHRPPLVLYAAATA